MDRVRFGRALGVGARETAKALLKAADAAAAPNPSARSQGPAAAAPRKAVATVVAENVERAKATREGVRRGGKRLGEAVWAPMAKASGVLWYEVTGVLFGMFAAAAGVAVWRDRGNFHGTGGTAQHAWFALAMFAVFAYFTVSSYVRAARRERR